MTPGLGKWSGWGQEWSCPGPALTRHKHIRSPQGFTSPSDGYHRAGVDEVGYTLVVSVLEIQLINALDPVSFVLCTETHDIKGHSSSQRKPKQSR